MAGSSGGSTADRSRWRQLPSLCRARSSVLTSVRAVHELAEHSRLGVRSSGAPARRRSVPRFRSAVRAADSVLAGVGSTDPITAAKPAMTHGSSRCSTRGRELAARWSCASGGRVAIVMSGRQPHTDRPAIGPTIAPGNVTERLRAGAPRRPHPSPGAVRRAHAAARTPGQDGAARSAQGTELAPPPTRFGVNRLGDPAMGDVVNYRDVTERPADGADLRQPSLLNATFESTAKGSSGRLRAASSASTVRSPSCGGSRLDPRSQGRCSNDRVRMEPLRTPRI